jgi:cob(I)alamin adenosyltransferase
MPKLNRIYTRTGDQGLTRLSDGQRVAKDSPRVQAYGSVDELNSWLGFALSLDLAEPLAETAIRIQSELFDLGADLSTPQEAELSFYVPRIEQRHVDALESLIDSLNEQLPSLDNFVLPGGDRAAAALHVARAVCRRTEREALSLSREETIGEHVLPYLNRLSDMLFVMARWQNKHTGSEEPIWQPGSSTS